MFASLTGQDPSERDQQAAKESFAAFKELVTRFPESRYSSDARQRMNHIVNSLARYEVHVARYYMSRGAYLAAINRAQQAVSDYRDAPALEDALYILMQAYDALGMPRLRDDTRRVLELNYPKSQYISQGTPLTPDHQ
jgi:outer membrane protein assembly factor BamD